MVEEVVPFEVERDGRRGTISDRRMRCEECSQVSYHGDQISQHERAVAAKIREMLGLLRPEELRQVREKYLLTQREMEELLKIGPKMWVRWERGKVVQSKAVDTLIRAIAADPALAQRLALEGGVQNAGAEAAFERHNARVRRRAAAVLRTQVGDAVDADWDAVAAVLIAALRPEVDAVQEHEAA